VEISNNGLTAYALSKAKNEFESNTVVGNMAFSEGQHYWEVICPITCNTIQFGVTCNPTKIDVSNSIIESFLSTTKRTVGVVLDLNAGTLYFWMNSRVLKKNKQRQLKRPGLAWYPLLKF
jgi:hypothetical protein